MQERRFAIATFDRVFDVTPKRDLVTLRELTAGLTTFHLRRDLAARTVRELRHLDEALRACLAGEVVGGRHASELRAARAEGGEAALRASYECLRRRIQARSKTDLRLWSPTHYRAGASRGAEGVAHLSCVVLDYDGAASVEAASAGWRDVLYLVHTTWSHTLAHPDDFDLFGAAEALEDEFDLF